MAHQDDLRTWDDDRGMAFDDDYGMRNVSARATFITKTYTHLFGAIIAFVVLEVLLFKSGVADSFAMSMASNWWLVLGAFMITGWIASSVAAKAESKGAQYAALAAYVGLEALIFVPLLWIATQLEAAHGVTIIAPAAVITLVGFSALTIVAYTSRRDFSFLKPLVMWGMIMAVITIFAAMIFGFNLGTWFSGLMVALSGAAILYQTSDIIRNYPTDRYIGAALGLFASVALMFWYILQLVISFSSDD